MCVSGDLVNDQIFFTCSIYNKKKTAPTTYIALLDTGAQITTITERVAESESLNAIGWSKIRGISSVTMCPKFEIDLSIYPTKKHCLKNWQNDFNPIQVCMLKGGQDYDFDILLGMDAIKQFTKFSLSENKFKFCLQ